jgi:hypothetical protein
MISMRDTQKAEPGGKAASPRPWWRRVFHWPLFCILATVHLLLLPLIIGEQEDAVIAAGGGVAYLALAIADLLTSRSRPATR